MAVAAVALMAAVVGAYFGYREYQVSRLAKQSAGDSMSDDLRMHASL